MRVGEMVDGRYRIEEALGSGGFSEVWRAVDVEMGRPVAVKIARAGGEEESNAELSEEAAVLASLDHPNIVRLLDSGVDGGRRFLVTELLDGGTLRDFLRESGPMSDKGVLRLGLTLAEALAAAHTRGLVHGDVKPENVMIHDGVPKLIDFGTARNLADTLPLEELRQIAGTLAYLAPELLSGGLPTPQSDVYSLGVTLYETRSGRLPFAVGVIPGSDGRRALPLGSAVPGVDPRLESAITESLAVDPGWRPASAVELRERLLTPQPADIPLRSQPPGDTQQLRPPLDGMAATAGFAGATGVPRPGAAWDESTRPPFPKFDEWVETRHKGRTVPRRLLAGAAVIALMLVGSAGAMALLNRDAGEKVVSTASEDSPADDSGEGTGPERGSASDMATATASAPSPSITPEPSATTAATATQDAPVATPNPPTPTAAPAIPTAEVSQQSQTQLEPGTGTGTVVRWYELVAAGRFEDAYALWSDRMKANFPRQGNLDSRWANTVNVSVNDVRVVSQTGNRMTVAIDFVETQANGTRNRYVGTWQLLASTDGWLLDHPNF